MPPLTISVATPTDTCPLRRGCASARPTLPAPPPALRASRECLSAPPRQTRHNTHCIDTRGRNTRTSPRAPLQHPPRRLTHRRNPSASTRPRPQYPARRRPWLQQPHLDTPAAATPPASTHPRPQPPRLDTRCRNSRRRHARRRNIRASTRAPLQHPPPQPRASTPVPRQHPPSSRAPRTAWHRCPACMQGACVRGGAERTRRSRTRTEEVGMRKGGGGQRARAAEGWACTQRAGGQGRAGRSQGGGAHANSVDRLSITHVIDR